MSSEAKIGAMHLLYQDFLDNQQPTFAEGLHTLNEVLATLAYSRCSVCNEKFYPNRGVWVEKSYYVPTGDLCAECIAVRNHAIELGLESSREIEPDDSRYEN
jgi:hypothetical protein